MLYQYKILKWMADHQYKLRTVHDSYKVFAFYF